MREHLQSTADVNWFSEKHHHQSVTVTYQPKNLWPRSWGYFTTIRGLLAFIGMLLFYDDAQTYTRGLIFWEQLLWRTSKNRTEQTQRLGEELRSALAEQSNAVCGKGDKLPTFGLTPLRKALRSPIPIIVLQNAIKYSELWSRWMITIRIVANKFVEFANTLESINNRPSKWNIINFIRVAIN